MGLEHDISIKTRDVGLAIAVAACLGDDVEIADIVLDRPDIFEVVSRPDGVIERVGEQLARLGVALDADAAARRLDQHVESIFQERRVAALQRRHLRLRVLDPARHRQRREAQGERPLGRVREVQGVREPRPVASTTRSAARSVSA